MKHVRIDEGTRRKPRRRQSALHRRNEAGLTESIPPDLDPDYVLQLYLTSPTTARIADKLGIRRSSLTAWLRATQPEKWKAVQTIRAHTRKEDGDDGLYESRNALELARAREVLRSAQWDLERLDDNYRPKQDVTHHASGPLIQINVAPIGQVAMQQVDQTAVSSAPLIQGK